jgi:GNAT superfamily N-acetyltransferase
MSCNDIVIAYAKLCSSHSGKHASLDDWLRERARTSEGLSARTYVICDAEEPARVVGYYAIATAMVRRQGLPSAKLRKGMQEEVPLLLIGRLALDVEYQGEGLGTNLLADALLFRLSTKRFLLRSACFRRDSQSRMGRTMMTAFSLALERACAWDFGPPNGAQPTAANFPSLNRYGVNSSSVVKFSLSCQPLLK